MKPTELGKIIIINRQLAILRQEICKYHAGNVPCNIMRDYSRLCKRKSKLTEILPIPKNLPTWVVR